VKVRRPELVLAGAVVLCLPMVPGILHGAVGITTALVRFLIALVVCWVGGAVLTSLLDRYSEESRRAEIARAIDTAQRAAAQRAEAEASARAAERAEPFGPGAG